MGWCCVGGTVPSYIYRVENDPEWYNFLSKMSPFDLNRRGIGELSVSERVNLL